MARKAIFKVAPNKAGRWSWVMIRGGNRLAVSAESFLRKRGALRSVDNFTAAISKSLFKIFIDGVEANGNGEKPHSKKSKRNKSMAFGAAVVLLLMLGVSAMAQDTNVVSAVATNNPLAPFDPAVGSLPSTKTEFWKWAISAITPVIIWLCAKFIPKIPDGALPVLTPIVGIGLGYGLNALAGLHLGWVDMGQAGAVAVFIREVINQNVTQHLNGEKAAKAAADLPPRPS